MTFARLAAPASAFLLCLGAAAAWADGQGLLRFKAHPGMALRYKVDESTVEVDLPRKGAPVTHRYDVQKEVWERQEAGDAGMLAVSQIVRWATCSVDGKPLPQALSLPIAVARIDPRGVPPESPTTAIVPTLLVLPPGPLPAPVETLGAKALARLDWMYVSAPLPAVGVPLTVRYWTEGPQTFLGRECVVIRGVSEAVGAIPADRPGIQIRGRLSAAFDPEQGVTVHSTSETRIAWVWPLAGKAIHKRISRVTRLTSELVGVTAWPASPGAPGVERR